ncbi:MAG TPA: GGDEF domain-containing protein [Sphingomonadaceae bacterium]|nr:GGDEF domain-containing protein [Sphingomonadaceae bacterium]
MGFDPATLLAVAGIALSIFALAMLAIGATALADKRWWVAAFAMGAIGFGLMIVSPENPLLWPRDLANVVFMLAYGFCHAGARSLASRRPVLPVMVGGAVVWLALTKGLHISAELRVPFASVLVCGYATLIAAELLRGSTVVEKARRLAGWLCVLHACFFAARAILGPTLGLLANNSLHTTLSAWAAILAFETIIFSAGLAMLILAALRDKEATVDRHLALTDSLTGVGNRRAFEIQARALLTDVPHRGPRPILLMMDLDGFKTVNDGLGHAAGDRLLVEVASAARHCLTDPDQFWRVGGDEFVALLCGSAAARAPLIAQSIRAAVKDVSRISAAAIGISVTIGLIRARDGVTLAQLLEEADTALYAGKNQGRDCVVIGEVQVAEALNSQDNSWRDRPPSLSSQRVTSEIGQPVASISTLNPDAFTRPSNMGEEVASGPSRLDHRKA